MEAFVIAALTGLVVGIFSGLLGVGGGTLMVPIFRLGFNMSAICSTGTSLFAIVPTSLVGCITHLRNKTCILPVGLICGLAGACTSPVGVYLASISPSWAIMLAASLIIGYSSVSMFRKALSLPADDAQGKDEVEVSHDAQGKGESQASHDAHTTDQSFLLSVQRVVFCIAIGFVAGLASGYVGVGGGFIMVPLFVSLLGIMMRQASGTSLVAVSILAIPGVVEQGLLGNIDYVAGIAMVMGSIPGAMIGANLIRRIPERKLRFIFGGFLLFSAVVLLVNELLPLFV